MRLDYALEGYWLSKRRGFSPHCERSEYLGLDETCALDV